MATTLAPRLAERFTHLAWMGGSYWQNVQDLEEALLATSIQDLLLQEAELVAALSTCEVGLALAERLHERAAADLSEDGQTHKAYFRLVARQVRSNRGGL